MTQPKTCFGKCKEIKNNAWRVVLARFGPDFWTLIIFWILFEKNITYIIFAPPSQGDYIQTEIHWCARSIAALKMAKTLEVPNPGVVATMTPLPLERIASRWDFWGPPPGTAPGVA
jgi:hypothetical protein